MPALIVTPVPGKKHPRMCNSSCYNAKNLTCCCICGGINHQAGLEGAVENTRTLMEIILEKNPNTRFSKIVQQLELKEEA